MGEFIDCPQTVLEEKPEELTVEAWEEEEPWDIIFLEETDSEVGVL